MIKVSNLKKYFLLDFILALTFHFIETVNFSEMSLFLSLFCFGIFYPLGYLFFLYFMVRLRSYKKLGHFPQFFYRVKKSPSALAIKNGLYNKMFSLSRYHFRNKNLSEVFSHLDTILRVSIYNTSYKISE